MSHPTTTPAIPMSAEEELLAHARKRVGKKMAFYTHALVFVLVNLGMYLINSQFHGARWTPFPIWGWALGLAIHGVVTFLDLSGEGLRERMLAQEVARLRERG